jgi:transmembrane sensor
MKRDTSDHIDELTLAEASAWLTRLQDSARLLETEAAFKEWLDISPRHARAFARVNDVWELIPGAMAYAQRPQADRHQRPQVSRHQRARTQLAPWGFATAIAALLLVVVGIVRTQLPVQLPVGHAYQTAIGEQRTVVLADDTRVTLNTDTRIVVEYRGSERHVLLERGEALFHVAHNPERPFVVQTGDEQIVDLGTVFDVRHSSQPVVVTLLEGTVWVGTQTTPVGQLALSTVLVPGQRLTIYGDGARLLDRPDVQEAVAWQHGQVSFNDTSLAEAVAELNRYSDVHIRIDDPVLAALRVSGVFAVRNPAQFASAVASLHNLRVMHEGSAIVLKR